MPRASRVVVVASTLMAICQAGIAGESYDYVCQKDDQQRVIRVQYAKAGATLPCEVHYIKGGSDQLLWSAQTQAAYCEEKAAEFAGQQRRNGWHCDKRSVETNSGIQ